MTNLHRSLVLGCSALALASCGADEIVSPGTGGDIIINNPGTPAPTPAPTPTPTSTLVTPAAGCPTISNPDRPDRWRHDHRPNRRIPRLHPARALHRLLDPALHRRPALPHERPRRCRHRWRPCRYRRDRHRRRTDDRTGRDPVLVGLRLAERQPRQHDQCERDCRASDHLHQPRQCAGAEHGQFLGPVGRRRPVGPRAR